MYHFETRPLRRLEKEFDHFFNTKGEESFSPICEVFDEEKHYTISLDVPGSTKEDIGLEFKENQLFVTGERKSHEKEQNKILRSERRYGKFLRVFTLPKNVQADVISAHVENGVLEVRIPKEQKEEARKISITDVKGP